jgi:UDP-arabinose 4-epimerase
MLSDLDVADCFRSLSLRYFNAAGADPEGKIGEAHDPEPHLIPRVLAAARDGSSLQIFGNDYDTPDGTCVRDYIHVLDIADAHVRAIEYLMRGGESCAINLANARGYSVKQVIATAERVSGRTIRVDIAPRRVGDPAVLVGSFVKAQTLLGWWPERSDLELQISDAWNWMKKTIKPVLGRS